MSFLIRSLKSYQYQGDVVWEHSKLSSRVWCKTPLYLPVLNFNVQSNLSETTTPEIHREEYASDTSWIIQTGNFDETKEKRNQSSSLSGLRYRVWLKSFYGSPMTLMSACSFLPERHIGVARGWPRPPKESGKKFAQPS